MKKLFTLICMLVLTAGTAIAQQVYTEFVEETGTLTYYYDTKMSSRSGITKVYNQDDGIDIIHTSYRYDVLKAVIDPSMKNAPLTSAYGMFSYLNMETIEGLKNLNTAIITDMSEMFYDCSYLTSLDLSSFNTANVKDMSDMFYECDRLTSLDLSSFNTANVTYMSRMFKECNLLTSLDLSSFNTAKVTNMSEMFSHCVQLKSLDLSSFDISNVTNMSFMFRGCESLTSLDLSSFNTANVTGMSFMFDDCKSLTSLDLSSFNTASVMHMQDMFSGCLNLQTIICNYDWSTSSVLENSQNMFYNCVALVGGKGTKYDSNVTDKTYARPDGGTGNAGYFTEVVPQVYTEFVKASGTLTFYYDTKFIFRSGVTKLYDQNVGLDISYKSDVLKAVIDPSMKDAPLTSAKRMFYRLLELEFVKGLENLNTANMTDMSSMFEGCESLKYLDLSSFNTAKVTSMRNMFSWCKNLTTIYCNNNWSTSSVLEDSYNMFYYCTTLVGGKGTKYDSKVTDVTYARPDGGTSKPGYFIEKEEISGRQIYTEFDETSHILTYYYDDQMSSRLGVTEVYDPIGNPDAVRFADYYYKVLKAFIDPSMMDAPLISMREMFYGYKDAENNEKCLSGMATIEGLENLNTANVRDMGYMFYGCSALKSLNLSSFNTTNVMDIQYMFYNCNALTSLDLSSFNTANIKDMYSMFEGCNSLSSLDLSSFNTANVTDMSRMFLNCYALTSLDLSTFNTEKVTDMSYMFYRCYALTSLDLSTFNTANVTDMRYMFHHCRALTSLDLHLFNTANVMSMSNMFSYCYSLKSLDLSSFNTVNVGYMESMFYNCTSLRSLDLKNFKTIRMKSSYKMFENCSYLKTIYCNYDWSTLANLEIFSDMFKNCNELVGGKGTKFDAKVTDKTYARPDGGTSKPGYFTEKDVLSEPVVYTEYVAETGTLTYYYDIHIYSRSGVTEMYDPVGNLGACRFAGYNDMVRKAVIDPSMKDAPLTSMERMFWGYYDEDHNSMSLSNMTAIEGMENLNTANVTNMKDMLRRCESLTSLDLSSFNTENVTDMYAMFVHCSALTSLDLSSFNTANVTDMSFMFDDCKSLTSLDLSSFNTENVTNMSDMFKGCESLTSLDLSSFNTANVWNMNSMFESCQSLKTILCNDDWSTSSVLYNTYNMFYNCTALIGGNGTKYDSNVIDATYARPDGGTNKPGYFTKYGAEVYTEFDEATGTLTFYYDDKIDTRTGITELYIPGSIRFTGYYKKVLKAVIDPSMKDAPITSMREMFVGGFNSETFDLQFLKNMTSIEGLENLNTAIVTDMNSMFSGCELLTSLDLSSFNTSNVTNMNGMFLSCTGLQIVDVSSFDISNVTDMRMMFGSCRELTTICCDKDWSTSQADSYIMFSGCKKLVGDKGTAWDGDVLDARYARPDGGTYNPGYFTADTMTGIQSIHNSQFIIHNEEEAAIYNLAGQKMVNGQWSNTKLPRGIYIKDGRKQVVK
ncbi:MAG: BspA family leucine-rich repeat surface protein [Bacteroidaceae bacterium]|nr:BspA family leucine-rich repeat surface protein [Bacteroidaceae bacterium]